MPWTMNDYPSYMENLGKAVRKQAIDIVDEGYDEGRAILAEERSA